MKRGGSQGEDRLIAWLRRRLDRSPIGDDAAVLPAGAPVAVTMDSQVAGTHFVPDLDPACVARRLLAVNLSDIAAMGGVPAHAFLALTAPRGFDHRRFLSALLAACAEHGVQLAGGDLARSSGESFVATLTLLGRRPRGGRWLHRGGAAPGHDLWLGGTVGDSAAGRLLVAAGARLAGGRVHLPDGWSEGAAPRALAAAARRAVRRHLAPRPQLDLGRWLARQPAGAAMDVSDGLARDLPRLCRESAAGARIEAEELPYAPRFAALCAALRADPLDLALHGGEDYVLLFTLPAGRDVPARFACRRIGKITAPRRISIRSRRAGTAVSSDLQLGGWDHLD